MSSILLIATSCIVFATDALRLPAAWAQSGSVKALFEKYNLLGTFARVCTQPWSKDNEYYVNRLLDANHVQRVQVTDASTRFSVTILDKAAELKPNEISVSGTHDGQPADGVWRLEQTRMLQWEATIAGKKLIGGGRLLSTGLEMPWLYKCDVFPFTRTGAPPLQLDGIVTRPSKPGRYPLVLISRGSIGTWPG